MRFIGSSRSLWSSITSHRLRSEQFNLRLPTVSRNEEYLPKLALFWKFTALVGLVLIIVVVTLGVLQQQGKNSSQEQPSPAPRTYSYNEAEEIPITYGYTREEKTFDAFSHNPRRTDASTVSYIYNENTELPDKLHQEDEEHSTTQTEESFYLETQTEMLGSVVESTTPFVSQCKESSPDCVFSGNNEDNFMKNSYLEGISSEIDPQELESSSTESYDRAFSFEAAGRTERINPTTIETPNAQSPPKPTGPSDTIRIQESTVSPVLPHLKEEISVGEVVPELSYGHDHIPEVLVPPTEFRKEEAPLAHNSAPEEYPLETDVDRHISVNDAIEFSEEPTEQHGVYTWIRSRADGGILQPKYHPMPHPKPVYFTAPSHGFLPMPMALPLGLPAQSGKRLFFPLIRSEWTASPPRYAF